MKKGITTFLVLGMLFAAFFVLAEDSTTTDKKGQLQEKIRQERKALNSAIKEKRIQLQDAIKQERTSLQKEAKDLLFRLKSASTTTADKARIKEELKVKREAVQDKAQTLRQNLKDNAKDLRDNFKEKVQSAKDRVRIAAAHGKGLKMLNRYRSAVVRFDHILARLESRTEKLKARGVDVSSLTPLIEEAKNMKVESEAKLEELKAKYESLLEGDNPQEIGKEAEKIAKELKAEAEKLHKKLKEIISAIKAIQPKEADESGE